MKKLLSACAALALISTPIMANPFDGVFVSNPEACLWIADEGLEAFSNHDFLGLTLSDGIVANEFGCTFLGQETTPDGAAMVVRAFCEYPGEPYPDLISLRTYDDNSITVTSMRQSAEDAAHGVEGQWGSLIYTHCDNLKELPR